MKKKTILSIEGYIAIIIGIILIFWGYGDNFNLMLIGYAEAFFGVAILMWRLEGQQ